MTFTEQGEGFFAFGLIKETLSEEDCIGEKMVVKTFIDRSFELGVEVLHFDVCYERKI